jgi:hypothetical protein
MGITQAEKETCLCTIIKDYVNPFPSVRIIGHEEHIYSCDEKTATD